MHGSARRADLATVLFPFPVLPRQVRELPSLISTSKNPPGKGGGRRRRGRFWDRMGMV